MSMSQQNITIESVITEVTKKNRGADLGLLRRAYEFAERAHKGQKRASGDPYITHPVHTAYTLSKMNLDDATIAAALLHDVVDDTPVTIEEVEKEFGKEIAFLVSGVTKLGKIKYRGIERHVENLRKMFFAMAEDIRVVLIKLADRLHNMETLNYVPEEKQKRIALETIEIYAPLAMRLGIGSLRAKLDDLAFRYAYPEEYQWVVKNVKEKIQEREGYLKKVEPILKKELEKEGIPIIDINYRAKHYWSLYQKLLKRNMDFSQIHDLIAMRIIVESIQDCYAVLGAIHKNWKPLPGLIKDYIALPKPNGYKSIHTTVFCIDGRITEFQIRTHDMHEEAEYGIAAHWAYTEGGKPDTGVKATDPRFAWVGQLREWQEKMSDTTSDEFLESLRIDFFKDRIFVLTPKGDVIDLPEDATPIDFAYQIHSDIGNQATAARINGKIASLDSPLKNGDVIEILIQKNKKPSEKWVGFVKTNNARTKIKNSLKKERVLLGQRGTRSARLTITARDRVGLLSDVSKVISDAGLNIAHIASSDIRTKGFAELDVAIQVKDRSALLKLVTRLKNVTGVEEIEHKIQG